MGSVYRRQVKFCTTCRRRLDRTAERQACENASHAIEARELPIWWIKYHVGGRPQCVSSGSDKKRLAEDLLKEREGDVVRGVPITANIGKVRFEEARDDLLNDYRTNGKRSIKTMQGRIRNHLTPFFGGRRMNAVSTALVRQFVARRQTAGASNAEINRELTALKRMFTLCVQSGKMLAKPYIPLLKENNVRQGFFEA